MAKLTDEIRKHIKDQLIAKPRRKSRENVQRLTSHGFKQWTSDALGTSPDKIEESRQYLRSHGIAAEYTPDGQLIVTSDKMFQDTAKAFGMKTGRDGYEVKDYEGKPIATGRTPVQERRRAKQDLMNQLRDFQY